MTKHQLERQIERLQKRINYLEERKNNLSVHGYWDLGYYHGQLSIMEDWLDNIIETNQIDLSTFDFEHKDLVPPSCRNCSNHPSNGGNGICNCTLGQMQITC